MKTVCFFNSTNFWGGGEKLHLEYASYFKKKGFTVFLACKPDSPLHQRAVEFELDTILVSIGDLSFLNPFAISTVAKKLKAHTVDTIVATTSEDIKMCGFAAKKAGIANIVYLRGLAVPIKNSMVNRFLFSSAITHVIANSKETERQIFKNLDRTKFHGKAGVIYHGIDTKGLLNDTIKLPLPNHDQYDVVLGNAGRLTEQKGQLFLIELAKELRDRKLNFGLYIAGDGDLKETLLSKIKEADLEQQVHLLGFVSEMNQFMNAIDIFLLSSAWEGFGFVLVEAMLKESPVVAFNTSSNPEIVANGETGFLVGLENTKAFADHVEQLITDQTLREKMGKAAKQRVLDHFDEEARIDEFIAFLEK